MSIGTIIFIITVIISIISAVNDKSHKKRQEQKKPQPTSTSKADQNETFLDKVQRKVKEAEAELLSEETETSKPQSEKKQPYEPNAPKQRTDEKQKPSWTRQAASRRKTDDSSNETPLKEILNEQLSHLEKEIDLERVKQKEYIEKRAYDILNDKYLSERTKRLKLQQLRAPQNNQSTNESLTFSKDPVVNGIIWSEIINKPKQL
ncbi:hypothetical protein DOS70_06740 [Staphylococcus felis]|uniref:hypothetical protein n=1 Tax=Staphylococcus felis TaxID=46127 RepID=UPI000E26400F|nr:hypothetical protein [Staphylococcus felis]REH95395.1 hypothetical protein DOS70_06740 [Staphylococcus felis]REH98956.1 hypothetical protein DOS67_00360 [Staphylococcus felis]REH99764.1 hypothetical protein DOS65_10885 [Staphylococcus felis]REI02240.1 hypothetical protein DOS62_10615 [Staphylococcus felis]REI09146.1 hypothetical protein DOS69_02580 [Staphylococcus felis]